MPTVALTVHASFLIEHATTKRQQTPRNAVTLLFDF